MLFQPLNTNTNGQTLLKECPLSVSSVVAEGQQYVSTRARNCALWSSGDLKPQVLPCFSEQCWWSLFGDFYWSPKKDQFMIPSVNLSSSFKISLFAVSSVHSSRQGWQRQLTIAMHWKTQQLTIALKDPTTMLQDILWSHFVIWWLTIARNNYVARLNQHML